MTTGETLGDLSETARGETHADLLAGSAGYQHFLQQLATFISPQEAQATHSRFGHAWKRLLMTALGFLVIYVAVNEVLGPVSLRGASWANDALRGGLFLAVILLVRRRGVSIAGQMLLPLASLCFLPFGLTSEPDRIGAPLFFGAVVAALFLIGWCLDAAADSRPGVHRLWRNWLPRLGIVLFVALDFAGYWWIVDEGVIPIFSVLAAIVAAVYLAMTNAVRPPDPGSAATGDIDFLYMAAWKRWRFFVAGRALAIVMGILPFLLFANLLDYQQELELCMNVQKAPDILRMEAPAGGWKAFYWKQQGRFLRASDFAPPLPNTKIDRQFYLVSPGAPPPADQLHLPPDCQGSDEAVKLPPDRDFAALESGMLALNTRHLTLAEFAAQTKKFAPLQITSRCRLLHRTNDPTTVKFVDVSLHQARRGHVCFAETLDLSTYGPADVTGLIHRYSFSKWLFFVIGVLGFVFLWRRGGDSSLARWIGLWLVGASTLPTITASDDTLPHLWHWLWQQSVLYHWNTLASVGEPMFNLLFIATGIVVMLWAAQISPAVCWTYICWPTRIYARLPAIVRPLMIVGKMALVVTVNTVIFGGVVIVIVLLKPHDPDLKEYTVVIIASTLFFLAAGLVLRQFTAVHSEVPKLGIWPVIALVTLNLSMIFYGPVLAFTDEGSRSPVMPALGAFFGCVFVLAMSVLILNRNFLRIRAVSGFTTLMLVLLFPLAISQSESYLPAFLTSGPFFKDRGAEMVSLMLGLLAFPFLHRWLHDLLLMIAVPRLRRIEHNVEHALEEIVDAREDHDRARLVSDLFEKLRVPEYLFLSRGAKGVFVVDMNKITGAAPGDIHVSDALRRFLSKSRNFVDLQTMAFEWPFFFHQFELYRLAEKTGCRYLLPVLVGNSVRGLLLLPDGPAGNMVSSPSVSTTLNNFGIAAALSRPVK